MSLFIEREISSVRVPFGFVWFAKRVVGVRMKVKVKVPRTGAKVYVHVCTAIWSRETRPSKEDAARHPFFRPLKSYRRISRMALRRSPSAFTNVDARLELSDVTSFTGTRLSHNTDLIFNRHQPVSKRLHDAARQGDD